MTTYIVKTLDDDVAVDIDAFECQFTDCFSADSLILTKNIKTHVISEVRAANVYSDTHMVFNAKENIFVPIIYNIVSDPIGKFILIEKDSIEPNVPHTDLYITPGHMIYLNGKEVKARNVSQGKRINTEPQTIYSICTRKRCPILVNGMGVMTWALNKWLISANERKIRWKNNKQLLNS